MNIRKISLATVAALALAAPAMAGPNGPQESTPAEKAQTEQLNQSQQNGSYVDPAVANGAASSANPVPAEQVSAAASNTATTDAQVQAQQSQYQNNLAQYDADRAAYENQVAAYEWQKRHPAGWWRVRYSRASFNHFYVLGDPALIDVAVSDRTGYLVGRVTRVERTSTGRVSRVFISLGYNRGAWIAARNLRYYPDESMILIDLTPRQIWQRSTVM